MHSQCTECWAQVFLIYVYTGHVIPILQHMHMYSLYIKYYLGQFNQLLSVAQICHFCSQPTQPHIYIFFTIRPTDQHARTCKSPYYVNTNTDKHTIHLHTCHTRLTAYTLNYCSVFVVVDRVQQGVCSQGFFFSVCWCYMLSQTYAYIFLIYIHYVCRSSRLSLYLSYSTDFFLVCIQKP